MSKNYEKQDDDQDDSHIMGCDTSYDYNDEADDDNKSLMKMAKILITMVRKMIAMSKKMMTATKKLMIIAQTNKQLQEED